MADEKKEKKTYSYTKESEDQNEKSRVWMGADCAIFPDVDSIIEEEWEEFAEIWDAMTFPGISKGRKSSERK